MQSANFQSPILLRREIAKNKPQLDFRKIKFISIKENLIIIATDDKQTFNILETEWPKDAFEKGIIRRNSAPNNRFDLIIKGVHQDIDLDDKEILDELSEIGLFNPVRLTKKSDKTPSTIVKITAKNRNHYQLALKNKIIISLTRYRCEPIKPIIQCFNCQQVGHTHHKCTKKPACMKCGGEHRFKNCDSNKIQCTNCNKEHFACARICQHLKTAVSNKARALRSEPIDHFNTKVTKSAKTEPELNPWFNKSTDLNRLIDEKLSTKQNETIDLITSVLTVILKSFIPQLLQGLNLIGTAPKQTKGKQSN